MPKLIEDGRVLLHETPINGVDILTIESPQIAQNALPGQFIQISVPDGAGFLRRPLGIAEVSYADGWIRLIYRQVGRGTNALASVREGMYISILGPLGHGFDTSLKHPLLVGGGMGLTPLLFYAAKHPNAAVLMGGRTREEIFWEKLYHSHVRELFITTDDGSYGQKGFVTTFLPDLLREGDYDGVAVCGPPVMMERVAAIAKEYGRSCEVSLEKHMACGLGACLSCAVDTKNGRKKVCKDGPVFSAEEVYYA